MKTKIFCLVTVLGALAALSFSGPALASTVVFSLSGPAVANQPTGDEPLDLGMDFTVNSGGVTVDSLGAFTNGMTTVLVNLYNITSGGAPVASATVAMGTPAPNYLFAPISPITLVNGDTYQIDAVYTAANKDYNPFEPYTVPKPTVLFNSLGGKLSFTGDYYTFGDTGAVATTLDTLSPNRYGAGTFAVTPLPSTWSMLFIGFVALGSIAFRGAKRVHSAAAVS